MWHGRLHAIAQKWTDMPYAITSANNFLGKSVVISRTSPVQLAGSVRKPTPNRPFICPILPHIRYIAGIPAADVAVEGLGTFKHGFHIRHIASIPSADALVEVAGVTEHVRHVRHIARVPAAYVSIEKRLDFLKASNMSVTAPVHHLVISP